MGARTHRNWRKWNSWWTGQTELPISTNWTWLPGGRSGTGQVGNMWSIGSSYTDKSKFPPGKLLNLSRIQLRILTGLLTGHCQLQGHLFKLRLVYSPKCDRCNQASETASHVLSDCKASVTLDTDIWVLIWWNQVTLKTSLSARCCILFKVRTPERIICRTAQKINHGWSAWVARCPPFCILLGLMKNKQWLRFCHKGIPSASCYLHTH